MPKQLLLTAMIDLPADLFGQADVLSAVRPAWRDFSARLTEINGLTHDTAMEITEAARSSPSKKPERKKRETAHPPIIHDPVPPPTDKLMEDEKANEHDDVVF